MNPDCYKEWSRQFLRDNFTLVFLTKRYRPHMENVLFDKEKSLLPEAQLVIEEKHRKRQVKEKIKDVENEIRALEVKRYYLEQELHGDFEKKEKERAEFVRECPAEGCRGFLSSQWKCGICELWTCPDCHELKGTSRDCEHECDPNNVETALLLKKDSKPCPSCHSLIFKISGCNQMFCTRCNTAFCWVTGRIHKKNIHNPHYFAWARNNSGTQDAEVAQQEDPNNCERELTHLDMRRLVDARKRHSKIFIGNGRLPYIYKPIYDETGRYMGSGITKPPELQIDSDGIATVEWFEKIIRHAIHLVNVEAGSFPIADYVNENKHIRVAYLEGRITEESFKTDIQRRDKKNRKNIEINQIIQFVGTAMKDIIFRLIRHLNDCSENQYDFYLFVQEVEWLILEANNLFADVSHTYNSVRYRLDKDLNLKRGEKITKKKEIHGGGGGGGGSAISNVIVEDDLEEDDDA